MNDLRLVGDDRHDLGKGQYVERARTTLRPAPDQCLCDGSWYKPDPEDMPHAGFFGYLTRDRTGKRLTPGQCRAFLAAGKSVNLVGQDGKRQAARGAAGGWEDSAFYNDQADENGAPDWLPIVYAVADYDAPDTDLRGSILAYVAATIQAGRRPVGVYGGVRTIDFLGDSFGRDVALYWQTVAWSGKRVSRYAHLLQRFGAPWYPLGGPTDDNHILRPFPRWGADESFTADERLLLAGIRSDATTTTRLLGTN